MGYLKMTGLKIGISRGLLNVSRNLRGSKTLPFVERSKRERREPFQVFRFR
jgi:hypothetical protein